MTLSPTDVARLRKSSLSLEATGKRRVTQWWVLTGAPGSGKTTLANALSSLGWAMVSDPGREEFEEQLALGHTPERVRQHYRDFQHRVIQRLLRTISSMPDDARVVFDYGIAESLAFMRVAGVAWDEETVQAAAQIAFGKVFLLDLVPLGGDASDPIRAETMHERAVLRELIEDIYEALGHRPVRVPLLPISERLAQLLATVNQG